MAKHHYLPGWHQQTSLFEVIINVDRWNAFSDTHKRQIEVVCGDMFRAGAAMSEAMQVTALEELKAEGVTLHQWSPEMLDKFGEATDQVMAEESANNEIFARVWESLKSFRDAYTEWREMGYL